MYFCLTRNLSIRETGFVSVAWVSSCSTISGKDEDL